MRSLLSMLMGLAVLGSASIAVAGELSVSCAYQDREKTFVASAGDLQSAQFEALQKCEAGSLSPRTCVPSRCEIKQSPVTVEEVESVYLTL